MQESVNEEELKKTECFKRLMALRKKIQKYPESGREAHLDPMEAHDEILRSLLAASEFQFDKHEFVHCYRLSKIARALGALTANKTQNEVGKWYDDRVVSMATELKKRWDVAAAPSIAPVVHNIPETDITTVKEPEDDDEMRGILISKSKIGTPVYSLDPNYITRISHVFGDNGLTLGQKWPLQICAVRDGCHGLVEAGVHGDKNKGTFSVVLSGNRRYRGTDRDEGDRVYYSSFSEVNIGYLQVSYETGKPIRLLRSANKPSNFAPKRGIRYDGLFKVTSYTEDLKTKTGEKYSVFILDKIPGQGKIAGRGVASARAERERPQKRRKSRGGNSRQW